MRKKGYIFRHVTDSAQVRREMQSGAGIGKNVAVELQFSHHRPAKTGYQIEKGSFPRARWTENARDGMIKRCVDLQREIGKR
jgi:hypothetical protein